MSTAGAAWGNTERTKRGRRHARGRRPDQRRARRTTRRSSPTRRRSRSASSNVTDGAVSRSSILQITDAGGGAGTWTVTLQPQTRDRAATTISVPPLATLAPGGEVDLPVTAHVAAGAAAGDDMGFVVLTKGAVTRRIPYYFEVTQPALANVPGDRAEGAAARATRSRGQNRVSQYRFPTWPFGPPPNYVGAAVNEPGAEKLYTIQISRAGRQLRRLGRVAVGELGDRPVGARLEGRERRAGLRRHAGQRQRPDVRLPRRHRGGRRRRSRSRSATTSRSTPAATRSPNESLPGQYVLKAWVNDLTPPTLKLVTTRVAAGRPTIVARREGRAVRRRSALARPELQLERPARRLGVRPDDRARALRASVERAEDHGGEEEEERRAERVRQPGGEERQHDRRERPAEHELPARARSRSSTSRR